jgi:hypothetical protein
LAPAPGPIINAQDPHRASGRERRTTDPPQEGVGTGGHPRGRREPGPGLAAESPPDEPVGLVEAGRRAGGGGRDLGEPFGEGLPRAIGRGAEGPTDVQPDADRPALRGQVGERPGVATMNASGERPAAGARAARSDPLNDQDDRLSVEEDILESEAGRVGEERRQRRSRAPDGNSEWSRTWANHSLYVQSSRKVRENQTMGSTSVERRIAASWSKTLTGPAVWSPIGEMYWRASSIQGGRRVFLT